LLEAGDIYPCDFIFDRDDEGTIQLEVMQAPSAEISLGFGGGRNMVTDWMQAGADVAASTSGRWFHQDSPGENIL
jgi:hypothetical protein